MLALSDFGDEHNRKMVGLGGIAINNRKIVESASFRRFYSAWELFCGVCACWSRLYLLGFLGEEDEVFGSGLWVF